MYSCFMVVHHICYFIHAVYDFRMVAFCLILLIHQPKRLNGQRIPLRSLSVFDSLNITEPIDTTAETKTYKPLLQCPMS